MNSQKNALLLLIFAHCINPQSYLLKNETDIWDTDRIKNGATVTVLLLVEQDQQQALLINPGEYTCLAIVPPTIVLRDIKTGAEYTAKIDKHDGRFLRIQWLENEKNSFYLGINSKPLSLALESYYCFDYDVRIVRNHAPKSMKIVIDGGWEKNRRFTVAAGSIENPTYQCLIFPRTKITKIQIGKQDIPDSELSAQEFIIDTNGTVRTIKLNQKQFENLLESVCEVIP